MKRIILAAVVAAALSAPLGSYAAGVHHPYRVTSSSLTAHRWPVTPPPPRARWMKVSCRTEDQANCAWNARAQGNHRGHSFYVVKRPILNVHGVPMGHVTCVYYVALADHRWDACHYLPR